jgi:hypothetical protein
LFPVDLLTFTAELSNNSQVQLKWSTATEKNCDHFEILRSSDGVAWEILARIESAINSSEIKHYTYVDQYPYNLNSYYRLKQHDSDGRTKEFPVVVLDLSNRLNYNVEIFPNPASDIITVQGDQIELESIHVYDLTGREINLSSKILRFGSNKINIDLSSLLNGVYIFRTHSAVMKVIKN